MHAFPGQKDFLVFGTFTCSFNHTPNREQQKTQPAPSIHTPKHKKRNPLNPNPSFSHAGSNFVPKRRSASKERAQQIELTMVAATVKLLSANNAPLQELKRKDTVTSLGFMVRSSERATRAQSRPLQFVQSSFVSISLFRRELRSSNLKLSVPYR